MYPFQSLPPALSYCLCSLPPLPAPSFSRERAHSPERQPLPPWAVPATSQRVDRLSPSYEKVEEKEIACLLFPHPKPLAQITATKEAPRRQPPPPTQTQTQIHNAYILFPIATAKGLHLQTLGGTVTQNRQELFLEAE